MEKISRKNNKIAGFSQLLSKRFDQFSTDYWPSFYLKAKGTSVLCSDKNWYKDMSISGIGACLFGYANEEIDESVIDQIKKGVATSLNSHLENEVANLLLSFVPDHDFVRYAKGGGEAMSIAVRIARAYTRKSKVLFSGYHGWSDWYLAANLEKKTNLNNHLISNLAPQGIPIELIGTSIPFEYDDIEDLQKKLDLNKGEVACIVMEPARSKGANQNYLDQVQELSVRYKVPLIFDEISCGFRQTNGPYSGQFNVMPDIYVFAKAIGNGYPIAAITGSSKIMRKFEDTFVSSTNWTEAIGLAAAKSVLQVFKDGSPETEIVALGDYWKSTVTKIADSHDFSLNVQGLPGMQYLSHPPNSDLFRTFFTVYGLQKKMLVAGRYYPNTAQTFSDIDTYGEILSSAIKTFKNFDERERNDFAGRVLPGGFNCLNSYGN
ncbi:MAG: hypothetical protein CBB97_04515 [Candidatus Endolissoclinum sp. TMED37]|nr:MAG: hypothetical protein CBB97_04515 [Candidatus Endolissoclinum sp. TMED37]